jgi:hypothetical protein
MPAIPMGTVFSYPEETSTIINTPITVTNTKFNTVPKIPVYTPKTATFYRPDNPIYNTLYDIGHPINYIDNTNAFKSVQNTIAKDINKVENFYDETVSGIKYIGRELEIGFNDFEKGSIWLWKEAKDVTTELYNGTRKGILFFENNYKTIFLIGGVYVASKFINEVKTAIN